MQLLRDLRLISRTGDSRVHILDNPRGVAGGDAMLVYDCVVHDVLPQEIGYLVCFLRTGIYERVDDQRDMSGFPSKIFLSNPEIFPH